MNVCVNVRKERERREPLYLRAREGERPPTWAVNHQMGEPSTKKCTRSLRLSGYYEGYYSLLNCCLVRSFSLRRKSNCFPTPNVLVNPSFVGTTHGQRSNLRSGSVRVISHRPHLKA